MKFKTIQKLFLSGVVLLGGCENIHEEREVTLSSVASETSKTSSHNTVQNTARISDIQAANFSTIGKQTKSYNTPNGTIRLYDIAQDPEVSLAIEDLYQRGDVTFGDVSFRYPLGAHDIDATGYFPPYVDVTPAVLLLTKARKISEYDLYRSSCKIVERAPCGNGDGGWGERYVSDCPSCNLGKVPDHNVEWIVRNYNRVTEKILTDDQKRRGRWRVYRNGDISETAIITQCYGDTLSKQALLGYYYIGEISGYSLAETKRLLLHSGCSEWNCGIRGSSAPDSSLKCEE